MKSIIQVFSFDIISKAILGVTGILLIRYMSPGEYARHTLAISLIVVVTQAFTTSLNRLYIVGYQKLGLDGSSSSFLGFQIASILVLGVMTYPFRNLFSSTYWFLAAAIIATCLSEFSKVFYQEKMRFLRFSLIELSRVALIAIGVIVIIRIARDSLQAWQVLMVQAAAMVSIFAIFFGRRLELSNFFRFREVLTLGRRIIRGEFKYLFGYFFLFALFGQIDIFMLRSLANDSALATYGSAFRYYTLVILALSSVHTVMLPITQKSEDLDELKMTFRRYSRLVLLIAPVIILGAWASRWIIPAIDAGKYPEAIAVFRILAVSAIISIAFSPYVNLVMKFEGFRFLFILVCGAIGIGVAMNIALVPRLGATGTAISTLASFTVVNSMTFVKGRQLLGSARQAQLEITQTIGKSLAPEAVEAGH